MASALKTDKTMAGPTARVLIPTDVHDGIMARVRTIVASTGEVRADGDVFVTETHPIGGRYRGAPRPFLLDCTPAPRDAETDWPDEREHEVLERHFGLRARGAVCLAAMSNDPVDHQILGELVADVARVLSGIVDFGGLLSPPETGDRRARHLIPWREAAHRFERDIVPYEGRLVAVTGSHYADEAFLRWWLRHPTFHMIK